MENAPALLIQLLLLQLFFSTHFYHHYHYLTTFTITAKYFTETTLLSRPTHRVLQCRECPTPSIWAINTKPQPIPTTMLQWFEFVCDKHPRQSTLGGQDMA
jgi:hypothetical protein